MRSKYKASVADVGQLRKENENLRIERKEKEKEILRLDELHCSTSAALEGKESEVTHLKAENISLNQRKIELESDVDQFEKRVYNLQAKCVTLEAKNTNLENRVRDLEHTIEGRGKEFDSMKTKVGKLEAEKASLELKYSELGVSGDKTVRLWKRKFDALRNGMHKGLSEAQDMTG